jgi:hypothetical protein
MIMLILLKNLELNFNFSKPNERELTMNQTSRIVYRERLRPPDLPDRSRPNSFHIKTRC